MNGDFAASTSQIKGYWPIVLILLMAIIVTLLIIYTKVYSPPLIVYYFEETNTLGTVFNNSISPQIASAGKDTYIVNIQKGGGSGNISIKKIVNNNTLASSFSISNASANSTNAKVAASGDNVYVVWSDTNATKGGNGDIFFSSSGDKAASFGEPINLSNSDGNSTNPEVAASGDDVHVVWSDTNGAKSGVGDIFFSVSRDNGVSFGEPINLSDNERNSTNPEVAASGKNVYVMWADSREETGTPDNVNLNLKTSADNGIHFGESKIVKRNVNKETHFPQITASDAKVYIILADKDAEEGNPDNFQVILRTSTDNGTEFSNKKSLKKDIDSKTHLPHLTAFGSNVYVVWSDRTDGIGGNADIFFSSSQDNAGSFGEPINISNNIANSTNPEITAAGNSVNIFWVDHSSAKNEIKHKQIRLAALR